MAPSLAAALLLLLLLLLFTSTTTANFTMKLIPRDALRPNNLTQTQHLERLIQHSKTYARRYGRSHLLRPVMTEIQMFYVVRATTGTGIGDGQVLSNLQFDLGSDLTWIQCIPCNPCFRHSSLTFNPPRSPTYHVLDKDHPLCILPEDPNRPGSTYCTYQIDYFDGSGSSGILSRDNFAFVSDNGDEVISIYQGVAFGCTMFTDFDEDEIVDWDGIIGMGQGAVSIVSQLGSIISHRFSYCLVKPESGLGSDLIFGPEPQRDYRTTPIFNFEGSGNYFLNLVDISIGTNRLNLPADTFRRNGPDDGGFVVDTGATVTHLIAPAYQAVENVVMGYLDALHLQRVGAWNDLELCYKIPPHPEAILPGMVFHFEDADYEMPWDNVFVMHQAGGIFCLGVMESDSVSLFGARMMANYRFSFNLENQVLLFAPEICGDVY